MARASDGAVAVRAFASRGGRVVGAGGTGRTDTLDGWRGSPRSIGGGECGASPRGSACSDCAEVDRVVCAAGEPVRTADFGMVVLSGEPAPRDGGLATCVPGCGLAERGADGTSGRAIGADGSRFGDAAEVSGRPDDPVDADGGALTAETFSIAPGVVSEGAITVAESTIGAIATHAVGESGFGCCAAALAADAAALVCCAAGVFDGGATFASTRSAPVEPGGAGALTEPGCGNAPTETGCGDAIFVACNDPLGVPPRGGKAGAGAIWPDPGAVTGPGAVRGDAPGALR